MPNIPARSHALTAQQFRDEVVADLKSRQSHLARTTVDNPAKSKKAKALAGEQLLLLQALITHYATLEFVEKS